MKLFIVKSQEVTWDQYDSMVVVAQSAEAAIKLCEGFFEEDQGEVTAEEVDMISDGIVLTSFNAG